MSFSKTILALILFVFPFFVAAQSADEVIKKYIAFIGGKTNWKNIKTVKTSGEYDYGGMKFSFIAYSKAPNLYKYVVTSEGKSFTQSFDGEKGWRLDGFENETSPKLLIGNAGRLMANEADVELESVFIDYKRKGHTATLDGKEKIDGMTCSVVKLTRNNGDIETYLFEENTGFLVRKVAKSKNAEMQEASLTTTYSEYREVKGVKFAFKAVSKINDQTILEVSIARVDVNTRIDDLEFQP